MCGYRYLYLPEQGMEKESYTSQMNALSADFMISLLVSAFWFEKTYLSKSGFFKHKEEDSKNKININTFYWLDQHLTAPDEALTFDSFITQLKFYRSQAAEKMVDQEL